MPEWIEAVAAIGVLVFTIWLGYLTLRQRKTEKQDETLEHIKVAIVKLQTRGQSADDTHQKDHERIGKTLETIENKLIALDTRINHMAQSMSKLEGKMEK